ncbi:unnamed protein product [Penicillium bialowiezense]
MAQLPDIVRDFELEAQFVPDPSVQTIHTYRESDLESGRRLVTRKEHWQRQRKIGSGSFGSVWLEKCTQGARSVEFRAVKQLPIHGSVDYRRELEAITRFSHPKYDYCFTESFGWYKTPTCLFIAMEYLERGNLSTYLKGRSPLPENEAQVIMSQILDGISMMHRNAFVHGDLNPNSHPPRTWWVKLSDFGLSKRIENESGTRTLKGTPGYMAPELYEPLGPSEKGSPYDGDIWAVGATLFFLLSKRCAFESAWRLLEFAKQSEDFPIKPLTDAGTSTLGIELITLLMRAKPKDRIAAEDAKSHKWLEKKFNSSIREMGSFARQENHQRPVELATNSATEEYASWDTKASHKPTENTPLQTQLAHRSKKAADQQLVRSVKQKYESQIHAMMDPEGRSVTTRGVSSHPPNKTKRPPNRPQPPASDHSSGQNILSPKLALDHTMIRPRIGEAANDPYQEHKNLVPQRQRSSSMSVDSLPSNTAAQSTTHKEDSRNALKGRRIKPRTSLQRLLSFGRFYHLGDGVQAAFSADSKRLALVGREGALCETLGNHPRRNRTFEDWPQLRGQRCVAFSPNGEWVVICGIHNNMKLLSSTTLKPTSQAKVSHYPHVVVFSHDSTLIAWANNHTVSVRRVSEGLQSRGFEYDFGSQHSRYHTSISFTMDSNSIVMACLNQFQVVELGQTPRKPIELVSPRGDCLGLSPDGKYLLIQSYNPEKHIGLIHIASGGSITGLVGEVVKPRAFDFSPDSKVLAVSLYSPSSQSSLLSLLEVGTERPSLSATQIDYEVQSLAFSPDGTMLAITSVDGFTALWGAKDRFNLCKVQ